VTRNGRISEQEVANRFNGTKRRNSGEKCKGKTKKRGAGRYFRENQNRRFPAISKRTE